MPGKIFVRPEAADHKNIQFDRMQCINSASCGPDCVLLNFALVHDIICKTDPIIIIIIIITQVALLS